MFKLKAGALAVACVFFLSVLSGCTPVAEEASTFARVYTPRGLGMQVADSLSSSSSESERSQSSSEESEGEPPAPAPEQPITGKVTEDPIFKPTEEDKK